jgi:membrane-associated phospholipid phosphatase
LVDLVLIDTVTEKSSSYRALQPPGLLNKYAAMPSLHFGWNLLVGVVIVRVTRRTLVRVFAVALPIAMAFAVVMTANHYVLDVIAGGIVALVGLALVVPVNRVLDATRSRVRW